MNRLSSPRQPVPRSSSVFVFFLLAAVLFVFSACATFRSKNQESDLDEVKKEIEEIQKSMSQVNLKIANIQNQVEFLEARLNELGKRENVPAPSGDRPAKKPEMQPETESSQNRVEPDYGSLPPEELYRQAIILINQKEYPQGVKLLRKFVAENPSSELADKAQYWIGEAFFLQNDFKKAIQEYSLVMKNYPNGNNTPDAYLKSAMAYEELKQPKEADNTLRELMERFPDSSAATVAKTKLTKREKE